MMYFLWQAQSPESDNLKLQL